MKFHAVLNRGGGTLRTLDVDAFAARLRDRLAQASHDADISIVDGRELISELQRAARRRSVDVVMIGGGDGSVSAAAGVLMGKSRALAVLPAGTMNLFARSLGLPLDLDKAVEAFASGKVREVDIATANGVPFVHQYSVGLHAKMVSMRDRMEFASRWGKIRASARAGLTTFLDPPSMRVAMTVDGRRSVVRTQGIGVTNNLFGEGHLPYADDPAGGRLGIYVTRAERKRDLARHFLNMTIGRWQANPHVDVEEATKVTLEFTRVYKRHRCVVDGELEGIDKVTEIEIHPGALKVLVPAG